MDGLQVVFHMNKGEEETSYAKNSFVQRVILSLANSMVEKAITNILRNQFPDSMGIADLGCSCGPNTILVMSKIIEMVYAASCERGRSLPELRISLNDLPSNDFNNVFMSLRAFFKKIKQEKGISLDRCFVSGVPGSFYGRLFPNRSLHFVHSSSSLHWLSQVPPTLQPNASVRLNKGKVFISKTSPSVVVEAYAEQYQKDLSVFLKSRSEEMVQGGQMVLSFLRRSASSYPTSDESCGFWELLARALCSMALDGLVEEEKIDSFNVPFYAPCPEEVLSGVAIQGSFVVDGIESFEIDWDGGEPSKSLDNNITSSLEALSSGQRVAKMIRAVVESILTAHFGSEIMDELFQRFGLIVDEHLSKTRAKYINLVISLVKVDGPTRGNE